jgi:hypothetical protein
MIATKPPCPECGARAYERHRDPCRTGEQEIIDLLEKSYGRKLTPQEIHLSLEQAREIGDL